MGALLLCATDNQVLLENRTTNPYKVSITKVKGRKKFCLLIRHWYHVTYVNNTKWLVLKIHGISKTILKCLNWNIIKRVNIGKWHVKPHLERYTEIDCGTKNQRQAIVSQYICYKKMAYNPNSKADLMFLKDQFHNVKIILS